MQVKIFSKFKDAPVGVIFPNQCHGDKIVEIFTGQEDLTACDALITKNKIFTLGIKTADCAPICFSDGTHIGIAHIGWRGLCLGLVEKMLGEFNQALLKVYVGPFNHSFEIKKDFCYEQIYTKFGDKFFVENDRELTFLFKDAIMSLLPEQVEFDPRNTFSDPNLPSFRRDKTTDRMVTLITFT